VTFQYTQLLVIVSLQSQLTLSLSLSIKIHHHMLTVTRFLTAEHLIKC
jgi:hypothetical protein